MQHRSTTLNDVKIEYLFGWPMEIYSYIRGIMKNKIVLLLSVGVFITVSALASDYDVGQKYKSELMTDLVNDIHMCVADLPSVYEPSFVAPVSLTILPARKGTDVKPSQAVNVYRRARDAI